MLIVLQLNKPRPSLRGYCRRFLLEPSSNLFVGNATRPLTEDLVNKIKKSGVEAILIRSQRASEMGMAVTMFGNPKRQIEDADGLPLIKRIK